MNNIHPKIHPKILEILRKRGIEDMEIIEELLSDQPRTTYDPFLLQNMKEAVDLVLFYVKTGKKICLYGDYDADGITSIMILRDVLIKLTDKLVFYIPSRFEEGYGLNKKAIRELKEKGVELIITVDLGSTSFEEVLYAKSIGLEIIITDHHTTSDEDMPALMINPKQKDCKYPFKGLAGCGVAYKFAQGIQRESNLPKTSIRDVLDLLALGTVGDIVPLIDENRTFVKYGLRSLNATKREVLKKIYERISLKEGEISSEQISYGLVPLLNAAGRINEADRALNLFMEEDSSKILSGVEELLTYNSRRKSLQEEAANRLIKKIDSEWAQDNFIIVYDEKTHEGVAGIVAGRLKDYYNRPVAVLTPTAEGVKGTSRSVEGINLYNVLKNNSELFTKFGGHALASGFLMREEDISSLRIALNEEINELIQSRPELFEREICYDVEMEINDISNEFIQEYNKLAPFGNSWAKPLIKIKNVNLEDIFPMGNSGQYLRFKIVGERGSCIKAVSFIQGDDFREWISPGIKLSVFGSPEIHAFNGPSYPQFNVVDIKREEAQ